MRGSRLVRFALLMAVLFRLCDARAFAGESSSSTSIQTSDSAVAQARQACAELWSDHKFDPLRSKIPLGDEKPTFEMLKNSERLRPKDRPLAELAIKAVEQCRKVYAPVFALLPTQVNAMMQGIQRRQDAIIAELYSGKITFGQYNIKANEMIGEFAKTIAGFSQSGQRSALQRSDTSTEKVPPHSTETTVRSAEPKLAASRDVRLALVIGDSSYMSLPKLANPVRDASAVADLLRKMGFSVKLVKDATEADLRREVRKFANESEKADIAFVYYAGHGAQVGGENYVLPVDISIPQTESDIQLTGLKVDDLVNSIRAKTKIVFLDACRDNPALFKNLVKGRGSYAKGLAPASASNIQQGKVGGGIFIAYATDSGSVALDGDGEHSPFAQALLRNLQKPISIDDMFSLVTREVRLVTKNAQRPYKYASLENIVCLSVNCSSGGSFPETDILQQAVRSESEDLQIALQTQNPEALEAYLVNYPDNSNRGKVISNISKFRRSEFDEWTLFGIANDKFSHYFKLSSAERFEDRVAILVKSPVDPSSPLGMRFPESAYFEQLSVYGCNESQMATAETTTFDKLGKTLYHYKWSDPQYVNLSMGVAIVPGTIAASARDILCQDQPPTPMAGKKELDNQKLPLLSSTLTGNGEIFYRPVQYDQNTKDQRAVLLVFKLNEDTKMTFPSPISDTLTYRTELDYVVMSCDTQRFFIRKTEYYDVSHNLAYVTSASFSKEIAWSEFREPSPYSTLRSIVCKPSETQK
jgi:Caspase domain